MLDKCPQCDYSLAGLPAAHTCPECKLRYDEASVAYQPDRRWRFFLYPAFLLAVMLVLTWDWWASVGRLNGWIIVSIVISASIVTVLVALGLRHYRVGPVVAAVVDGLYVRLGFGPGTVHPWTELDHPVRNLRSRKVIVPRKGKRRPLSIRDVFATEGDAHRLKAQIEQRISEATRRNES